jgi:formylmethanofuran dehydrogenase subunit E
MLERELLEFGLRFHGHKCPALPLGLWMGLAAMERLGVSHAPDGQLHAVLELDEDHCATCLADGVQVATGCTYGKGNIQRLGYGKFGLTLFERKSGRAVRVSPKAETVMQPLWNEFRAVRKSGVPPSQIPASIADPLFETIAQAPAEDLLSIGDVFTQTWKETMPTFQSVVCAECGERVIERNARIREGRTLCIPCSGYGR